ncbi:hypothetical protein EDB81DRAFT_775373 [Dactylonectria macrodidyma]|uniref:Protein FAF1 n=1 Tax=Dactylonectria macrodidyma TaxID=307937 RepID=A0A9P9FN54_9HYPO|nr:hypothetical protein EDB81DRAFT_775373 [Dactylonectria macrodidyma]
MAVLGKRKAREGPSISQEDAAAIFRRHFESQFLPLPDDQAKAARAGGTDEDDNTEDDNTEDAEEEDEDDKDDDGEENGDDEEWGGLSEDESNDEEEASAIEVVDHSGAQAPAPTTMSKRELKAFMSCRPPDQTSKSTTKSTITASSSSSNTLPEDAPSLLAQDLELRRLLAESHLLAPALASTGAPVAPKPFAAGRTRQKATDLRIQALGSQISIHKQEKMPMNIRKGIVAAAGARESKRRREAKENGVILERETGKKSKRRDRGRDFGVDRPGVGRLRGATLRLSDKDVRGIEGVRDTFGRRGKR